MSEQQQFSDEIIKLTRNPDMYKNYLLKMMIDNDSSDMYITYGEPPVLRIYDKAHRIHQLPKLNDEQLTELAYMFMDDLE
jgi:Tfp pilus assembly ATPase PilU